MRKLALIILGAWMWASVLAGCATTVTPVATPTVADLRFSGAVAYKHVEVQVAFGPRPVGTSANRATADYIAAHASAAGWEVERQPFEHLGKSAQNVIAKSGGGDNPIILGAHYDTRPVADQDQSRPMEPVPGANDGASGVAVLLELARTLDRSRLKQPVWLVFFDAEDMGRLNGWEFSVGAKYMAEHLTVIPQAVIVVDMIGDADQQIYMEANSTPELSHQLWDLAGRLGLHTFIPETKWRMIDDHLPFRERGIPAVLLIDFEYPYWHTVHDTVDKVSPESLERVGSLLEHWLEGP